MISCHIFLACQVSIDRSATSLPLYVRACLSLAAFRIFSLSLYFASFTMICHAEDRFKLCLKGVLCASWISMLFSFPRSGKFSSMICASVPSVPFSLSFSSGILMIQILFCLIASLSSPILPSYSWIFFIFSQLPLYRAHPLGRCGWNLTDQQDEVSPVSSYATIFP